MDGSESREKVLSARTATGGNGGIAVCWSCHGPVADPALFCQTCAAVQPPGKADHFARLGFGVGFDIDPGSLDRNYFERQRQLHPDRFATRTARERALSQSQATSINEAYETLKDSLLRAEYLLHLGLRGATPEGCHLINDLELLTEAMELREALAEASTPAEVAALTQRAAKDIDRCAIELSAAFAADDFEGAARLTTRLKYLRKLAEDCRVRRLQLAPR